MNPGVAQNDRTAGPEGLVAPVRFAVAAGSGSNAAVPQPLAQGLLETAGCGGAVGAGSGRGRNWTSSWRTPSPREALLRLAGLAVRRRGSV